MYSLPIHTIHYPVNITSTFLEFSQLSSSPCLVSPKEIGNGGLNIQVNKFQESIGSSQPQDIPLPSFHQNEKSPYTASVSCYLVSFLAMYIVSSFYSKIFNLNDIHYIASLTSFGSPFIYQPCFPH